MSEESKVKTRKKDDEASPFFTFFDAVLSLLSLSTFVADVITDVIVVILYASGGHYYWTGITITVILASSIAIHFFSLRWYVLDGRSSIKLCLINFLQLGVIYRYVALLRLGFKLRHSKDIQAQQDYQQRHSDVCMLRLFECFLESAPQIVLQMYIMFSTEDWNTFTEISVCVSILSLAGGVASYGKSIRMATPHKGDLSWVGLFLQMAWRAGTLTSRILAMVLAAYVLKAWFLLVCFCHWLFMMVWISLQRTDFCATWWEERIYNAVVGVIYCFCFFNLKEGRSRYRLTSFYTLMFLENVCFAVLYCCYPTPNQQVMFLYAMFACVVVSFAIGMLCMMIYYCCFHPRGSIFPNQTSSSLSDLVSQKSILGLLLFRTLKSSYLRKSLDLPRDIETPVKQPKLAEENANDSTTSSESAQEWRCGLLEFFEESPILRCLDDRSCHSLDCLPQSDTRLDIGRPPANHHRHVNYSFRPQVANGQVNPSLIHCSCLVLHT